MKTYRGYRHRGRVIVLAGVAGISNGSTLYADRSQRIRNHSPDGFEWGYEGSGPAQLALAILLDATDDREIAEDNYQDFKRQFVANFGDEWEIDEDEIREWLDLSKTRAE